MSGEKALVSLYGGVQGEGLDKLRHKRFYERVSKTTSHVEPQSLPPTSSAAKFHSLRVYYQVMEWKGTAGDLKPEEWGLGLVDKKLFPVSTDLPPVPTHLLQL